MSKIISVQKLNNNVDRIITKDWEIDIHKSFIIQENDVYDLSVSPTIDTSAEYIMRGIVFNNNNEKILLSCGGLLCECKYNTDIGSSLFIHLKKKNKKRSR